MSTRSTKAISSPGFRQPDESNCLRPIDPLKHLVEHSQIMMLARTIAVLSTLASPIYAPRAMAQLTQGVCYFYKDYERSLTEQKICALDSFNSGLVTITTNNGTIRLELHDSRINTYSYNGRIWRFEAVDRSGCCPTTGGTFRSKGDSIHFSPLR